MGHLGDRAHLLSRWMCQSALRVAAMGTCVSDETSSSASLAGGVALGTEIHRSRHLRLRPRRRQAWGPGCTVQTLFSRSTACPFRSRPLISSPRNPRCLGRRHGPGSPIPRRSCSRRSRIAVATSGAAHQASHIRSEWRVGERERPGRGVGATWRKWSPINRKRVAPYRR